MGRRSSRGRFVWQVHYGVQVQKGRGSRLDGVADRVKPGFPRCRFCLAYYNSRLAVRVITEREDEPLTFFTPVLSSSIFDCFLKILHHANPAPTMLPCGISKTKQDPIRPARKKTNNSQSSVGSLCPGTVSLFSKTHYHTPPLSHSE